MIAHEESELREAWRAVANAKLVDFAARLGGLPYS